MRAATTPMLQQFWQIKSQHPDKILFFRLGDFYEMFYDDAEVASRELELTLTARENSHERVPMCGVPHHAAEPYIGRLIERGYKVAVCEQVEDPRTAKGIVRRQVVRVVTPGTVFESGLLDDRRPNFLAALCSDAAMAAIAALDLSTGACEVTQIAAAGRPGRWLAELERLAPAECLVPADQQQLLASVGNRVKTVAARPPEQFNARKAENVYRQAPEAIQQLADCSKQALGALLAYVEETQGQIPIHLQVPRVYGSSDHLILDATACRHLELTRRQSDGSRSGTLLAALDFTETAMGARCMQSWLERPLVDRDRINQRLDAVETLKSAGTARRELKSLLDGMYDLERLASRIAFGTAGARDLAALRNSLRLVPSIENVLQELIADGGCGELSEILQRLDALPELVELLTAALADDPPGVITEGGLIRTGYHPEVDALREAARSGRLWLAELEQRERDRTGIRSLKVGYNKVFGYFVEVSRSHSDRVPADYERRQTLANAERFVTPELKEIEERIIAADERLVDLEYELFLELRAKVASRLPQLQATAGAIAELDVLLAFAEVAALRRYVRPYVDNSMRLEIKAGRHPVLDALGDRRFVPNDTPIDGEQTRMMILTGPNMGGKSTYLRQNALLVVMAQAGSFVPAESAVIGIVDRIFTRIGAADDLSRGDSTFMVEIKEALQVLLSGTRRSLAIIDELGRGTSTFDGIAFSVAYLEHLYNQIGCRTLVSTHFFELTSLAQRFAGIANHHVQALMDGGRLVFSYRVQPGAADRSYGVEVARSGGMPDAVILRARELLAALERGSSVEDVSAATGAATGVKAVEEPCRLPHSVQQYLRMAAGIDVLNMTPLQGLEHLQALAEQARKILAEEVVDNIDDR